MLDDSTSVERSLLRALAMAGCVKAVLDTYWFKNAALTNAKARRINPVFLALAANGNWEIGDSAAFESLGVTFGTLLNPLRLAPGLSWPRVLCERR